VSCDLRSTVVQSFMVWRSSTVIKIAKNATMLSTTNASHKKPRSRGQDRRRGLTAGIDRLAADRDVPISEPLISHHLLTQYRSLFRPLEAARTHIQGKVAIPDAQLRNVSLGDVPNRRAVGNGETSKMGQSPARNRCRHAHVVVRISTLQITMCTFRGWAAVRPGLICLVRTHKWQSSWDNEQKTVWTCARCGRTRVRIGEMDPRRTGWG
jgi:hypothetical protein